MSGPDAGLVYGTCRRITGDHHAAEDLAQDVLLEFAQKARQIRQSAAGFLHTTARSRALNHRRNEAVRQRHEDAAGQQMPATTPEPSTWRDLEPLLDEALDAVGEDERAVIVLHFLEGRNQTEVAEALGINQATVSRRLTRGLEALRARLASAGLVLTAAMFTDLCAAHAAEVAPPAVLVAMPKIGLAGMGAVTGGAVGVFSFSIGALAIAIAAVIGWRLFATSQQPALPIPPFSSETTPERQTMSRPSTSTPAKTATTSPHLLPKVDGQVFATDSFLACLQAGLAGWGRPVSMTRLAGFSGLAFSPVWNGDESTHFAVMGGGERQVPFLGQALGFMPEAWTIRDHPQARQAAPAQAARREFPNAAAFTAALGSALDDGRIVLLGTFPCWSLVVGRAERPADLRISTIPGMEATIRQAWGPEKAGLAWVLAPVTPPSDPSDTYREAVRRGQELAGMRYELAADAGVAEPVAGGATYDGAMRRLSANRICPSCQDDSGCTQNLLDSLHASVAHAAPFLDEAIAVCDDEIRPRLLTARDRYATLATRLDAERSGGTWPIRWKDPDQRILFAARLAALGELHLAAVRALRGVDPPTLLGPDALPRPTGTGNAALRGLEILFAQVGSPVTYEDLMGWSGKAFIIQADPEHRFQGMVDIGWWPLDGWGLDLRLDFLSQAAGRRVEQVGWPRSMPKAWWTLAEQDPQRMGVWKAWAQQEASVFSEFMAPQMRYDLALGRLLLAGDNVITDLANEQGQPVAYGVCCWFPSVDKMSRGRSGFPLGYMRLGGTLPPMTRDQADVESLRHAVALIRDQVPISSPFSRSRSSGGRSWTAWSRILRDEQQRVQDRHQANMQKRLLDQRAAAVGFLRGMANRQPRAAASLARAISAYEEVMKRLRTLPWNRIENDRERRLTLAGEVETIGAAEVRIADILDEAATILSASATP